MLLIGGSSGSADDIAAVRAVNEAAFGRKAEADLVDRLRAEGAMLASFVAEHDGRVVGHILFSRTLIETADECLPGFYQQFGFSTDRARALATPFPPYAFMALELVADALEGVRGMVRYPAAFGL